MKYLEDMTIGERWDVGSFTFTAENIKEFATKFDPQPFHIDEEAAKHSHFGALIASGWQTASVWMRLLTDYLNREDAMRRACGERSAVMGPAPGFRELKWLSPVYVGDTVSYSTEVVALRPSASRPGWGLVSIRNTGVNQHGKPVISFVSTTFIERRPGAN